MYNETSYQRLAWIPILCLKFSICEAQIHVVENKCQNEASRFTKEDTWIKFGFQNM